MSATINLIRRLNIPSKASSTTEKMIEYTSQIYYCWNKNLNAILKCKTSFDIWLLIEKSIPIIFIIASRISTDNIPMIIEDIIKQIQIYSNLVLYSADVVYALNNKDYMSKALGDVSRTFTLLTFLIGVMLIDYMHKNKLSDKELCQFINTKDPKIIYLVECILDHNSYLYAFTLQRIPELEIHRNVKQKENNVNSSNC